MKIFPRDEHIEWPPDTEHLVGMLLEAQPTSTVEW